jgi:hypothetical protein
VRRLGSTRVIDLVSVPLRNAAGLFCLLDDDLTCVLSLQPPPTCPAPGEAGQLRALTRLMLRSARYVHAPTPGLLDVARRQHGYPAADAEVVVGAAEDSSAAQAAGRLLDAYTDLVNRRKAA